MPATKLTCPHCGKHLKMSKPPLAGHRVLCSGCGHSFSVPADNVPHAVISHDSGSRKPQDSAEQPYTPSRIVFRQRLAIGLVLGGLLFLLVASIGGVLYFARQQGPSGGSDPQALSAPSDDADSSADPPLKDDSPPTPPPPTRFPSTIPTEPEFASWLPAEEQERINKTIDRGVQWLKEHQQASGSWGRGGHEIGLAALPALTLLECGVPADDNHIQKALHHVRKSMPRLNQTYELSLAILFLDRLGDPSDEGLIQTCALRLLGGQKASGGWTYTCPMLTEPEEKDLLFVLRQTQPHSGMDLFVGRSDGAAPPGFIAARSSTDRSKSDAEGAAEMSKLLPLGSAAPLEKPREDDSTAQGPHDPQAYTKALERLPIHLRKLPSLRPPKEAHKMPAADGTDNSNTQFAILGLSAAQRHKLPLDRALALIVQRFHTSQLPNGRWNYHYNKSSHDHATPAMTGAGLLGLAVGLGLAADHRDPQAKPQRQKEPAIEKGFDFLAESIGKPLSARRPQPKRSEAINLYFLWTVERCGVLYKRRDIGGKDWYRWGVELLLDHQNANGSWMAGNYPGSMPLSDTCFALLFLKRANLAKELTKKLEFFTEGKVLHTSP